jgi:Ser/Thr protein kinase RdoA (MazF antagonist)
MPSAAFTSSSVLPVLRAACAEAGFSADSAELLRLGENAIWRLADAPVVVRIARSSEHLDRVRKELCVARWLAGAGVPVVRVAEEVTGQPRVVDGHPVTFWVLADGNGPSGRGERERERVN